LEVTKLVAQEKVAKTCKSVNGPGRYPATTKSSASTIVFLLLQATTRTKVMTLNIVAKRNEPLPKNGGRFLINTIR
jgi:hypothetical protein